MSNQEEGTHKTSNPTGSVYQGKKQPIRRMGCHVVIRNDYAWYITTCKMFTM